MVQDLFKLYPHTCNLFLDAHRHVDGDWRREFNLLENDTYLKLVMYVDPVDDSFSFKCSFDICRSNPCGSNPDGIQRLIQHSVTPRCGEEMKFLSRSFAMIFSLVSKYSFPVVKLLEDLLTKATPPTLVPGQG